MADRTVSVDFIARVGGFTSGVQKMRTDARLMRGEVVKASRDMSAEMQTVGIAATAMGVGILGGLGASAKAAMDFESSFAGVRKTIDASEAEFAALSEGFRGLAREIPISVNELNGIGEAAGQLGIAKENILDFSATMADLGVATNMTAETAATEFARFANITQMPQENFDRLGSTVVDLGNNLATTEAEISEFGLRIAGAGAQIGMTEAEILGLGGALSSVGINAEAGGTAISKVMIDMAMAVSEGGEQLGLFAEVAGTSAASFAESFRDDPAAALAAFIEGLGRVDAAGGDLFATLEGLGITEQRMRDAMLRTAGAGSLVADSMRMANDAWEENTALTDEAAQRYQTLESRLTLAKNAIYDAGISLGQTLTPALGGAADAVTGLAGGLADLPGSAQLAIAGVGGLAGVASLAAGGFLLAAPRIVATKAALDTLAATMPRTVGGLRGVSSLLMGPWGIALGAATAGIGLFTAEKGKARARVEELTEAILADSGALGENTRAHVANRLETEGLLEAAADLGLNLATVTDAAMGNSGAMHEVNSAITSNITGYAELTGASGEAGDAQREAGIAAAELRDGLGDLAPEMDEATAAARREHEATAELEGAFFDAAHAADSGMTNAMYNLEAAHGEAAQAARDESEAIGGLGGDLDDAAGATGEFADATDDAAEAGVFLGETFADIEAALKSFSDAMATTLGMFFDVEAAQDGLSSSYQALADQVEDAIEAEDDNARALEGNSKAALANREALRGIVGETANVVQAMADQGASSQDVAGYLVEQRERLLDTIEAMGFSRAEAATYIDALEAIPTDVQTDMTVNAAGALSIIDRMRSELANIPRTVTTRWRMEGRDVAGVTSRGGVTQHAGGWAGSGPTHRGPLKGDEIPAVLQTGEYVLSRDMLAGRVPVFHAGGGVGGYDIPSLFAMTRGPSGGSAGSHLASIEAMKDAYAEMDRILDDIEQTKRRQALLDREAEASADIRAAKTEVAAAKDKDDRERARESLDGEIEALEDARAAIVDFDREAALSAERRQIEARIATAEANQRIAANREEWEFGRMSSADQIGWLEAQIVAHRRYTDEWMRLSSQRVRIIEAEASDRAKALEEAADAAVRAFDDELDALNRMLSDRTKILGQLKDAERSHLRASADEHARYAEAVASAQQSASEAIADAIKARRDQLAASMPLDAGFSSVTGLQARIDHQLGQLTGWQDALAEARTRGVSADTLSELGLDVGPEALGRLRVLLRAEDEELASLNESVATRMRTITDTVQREQGDANSVLAGTIRDIHGELASELTDLQAEHQEKLADMAAEFAEEQKKLGDELAAIGKDNGLNYAEAIAAGIASGIPAIEAQVAHVQALMQQMAAAEAAAANTIAAKRAGLGLVADAESDRIWEDRLAAGTADMDEVERRLRQKATGNGATARPTLGSGVRPRERSYDVVYTGAQAGSPSKENHYHLTVNAREVDKVDLTREFDRMALLHG